MADFYLNIRITTMNANVRNIQIKRQRLSDWIKKQDPAIYCLQKIHFKYNDTNKLKVKDGKDINCKH